MSNNETYKIDATGQKLGRIASEIAIVLQGKNTADYAPNKVVDVVVEVSNIGQLEISNKKREEKTYTSYTGYPGGLKYTPMKDVEVKHGTAELLHRAVRGMLPNNKLRNERLKRLVIVS